MVKTLQHPTKPIDFSIMPSFHCNLHCSFCMYDAGPDNHTRLNYDKTKLFLAKIDWSVINACGFYGGEPSIDMGLYQQFIDLIPKNTQRFVITNGTWSSDANHAAEFLYWCTVNKLRMIVSSTQEHIVHQDREFLQKLAAVSGGNLELKKPDEIHAQGRAKDLIGIKSNCQSACMRTDRNTRLGIKPDGNIVYQNCHGEYHIIQSYEEPFMGILNRVKIKVDNCLRKRQFATYK